MCSLRSHHSLFSSPLHRSSLSTLYCCTVWLRHAPSCWRPQSWTSSHTWSHVIHLSSSMHWTPFKTSSSSHAMWDSQRMVNVYFTSVTDKDAYSIITLVTRYYSDSALNSTHSPLPWGIFPILIEAHWGRHPGWRGGNVDKLVVVNLQPVHSHSSDVTTRPDMNTNNVFRYWISINIEWS